MCIISWGRVAQTVAFCWGQRKERNPAHLQLLCGAAPEFSHLYFKVQKELSQLHNSSVDTVVCPSVPSSSVILILLTMIKHYFCSLYIHIIHNDGLIPGAFENISKVFLFKIVVEYSSNMLPSRSCKPHKQVFLLDRMTVGRLSNSKVLNIES